MEDQPIRDERICEALDACRPGSADLADPALAHLAAAMAVDPALEELHQRLERVDARVAAAFQDVPVPEGLAERLLQQLSAAQALQTELIHEGHEEGREETLPVSVTIHRVSRRWLLAAAVPLCAAAGLLIAIVISSQQSKPYTASMVREEATSLFCSEEPQPGRAEAPPEDFPFSRDVLLSPGTQWRPVSHFLGRDGVAYDLPNRGGARATLYVVRCKVADLPFEPPQRPAFTTANCSTAAWEENGLVYVLVVSGGEGAYRSYLDLRRGPMA